MFQKPGLADLRQAAQQIGMNPSDDYLVAVEEIIAPLADAYATLDEIADELPAVKYPREAVVGRQSRAGGRWRGGLGLRGRPGRPDSHAREQLRHRRPQADLWSCALYRHRAARDHARHVRADDRRGF